MIIGFYGFIGVGKSTSVSYLQEEYGFNVIDLDKVSRVVMAQPESITFVRNYIPEAYSIEKQAIDDSKLREVIFTNWKANKYLAKYIWPKIAEYVNQALSKAKPNDLIAIEAAVLPALNIEVDQMIYVSTDNLTKLIERVKKRDHRNAKETAKVINIQSKWNRRADYDVILINDDSIADLHKKLDKLMSKYYIKKTKA